MKYMACLVYIYINISNMQQIWIRCHIIAIYSIMIVTCFLYHCIAFHKLFSYVHNKHLYQYYLYFNRFRLNIKLSFLTLKANDLLTLLLE